MFIEKRLEEWEAKVKENKLNDKIEKKKMKKEQKDQDQFIENRLKEWEAKVKENQEKDKLEKQQQKKTTKEKPVNPEKEKKQKEKEELKEQKKNLEDGLNRSLEQNKNECETRIVDMWHAQVNDQRDKNVESMDKTTQDTYISERVEQLQMMVPTEEKIRKEHKLKAVQIKNNVKDLLRQLKTSDAIKEDKHSNDEM